MSITVFEPNPNHPKTGDYVNLRDGVLGTEDRKSHTIYRVAWTGQDVGREGCGMAVVSSYSTDIPVGKVIHVELRDLAPLTEIQKNDLGDEGVYIKRS